MKEKNSFPIRVEKNGVTVPVYRMRSGSGYISYVIAYREDGTRKKQGFTSIAQARRAAKKAAGHFASGNVQAVKIRPEDGHAYLRAAAVFQRAQPTIPISRTPSSVAKALIHGRNPS